MSGECITFPATVEEFMEQYKMVDTEHMYSNGIEYVPIFRMQQWFEHQNEKEGDVISRQATIDYFVTNVGWHDDDGYPVEDSDELRKMWTNLFNGLPSVQPERAKGHWIKSDKGIFLCLVCHNGYKDQPTCMGKPMFEFCPICGSDMRGETKAESEGEC